MNIRVDMNTPIKDGTEAVFRSPVDCSQVTGLIVYYPENGATVSKEFAFADAHGNNVGDIDHLFAENVAVKVILVVTTGMAFVQNADTNAYLEGRFDEVSIDDSKVGNKPWSSKNIIDRLCPKFGVAANVVQCEPVEGYPLHVITELSASEDGYNGITLTQCGKNLFNKDAYEFVIGYVYAKNGEVTNSQNSNYCRIDAYIDVSHLQGQTITLNHPPIEVGGGNPGMAFYDAEKVYISGTNDYTMTVPDNAVYMRFSVPLAYKDGTQVQIELGSAVTEYEAYQEQAFTVEFPQTVYGGRYLWYTSVLRDENGNVINLGEEQYVTAMSGINNLYSSSGTTSVTGRKDPIAVIEKLTQAVISLGGNI